MQLPRHQASVRPEWVDANGHMNLAYYIVVFDHATDVAFAALGMGPGYRARTGCSSFVVETHTLYEREVMENERLEVTTRLLGADAKRLHLFHEMFRLGDPERVAGARADVPQHRHGDASRGPVSVRPARFAGRGGRRSREDWGAQGRWPANHHVRTYRRYRLIARTSSLLGRDISGNRESSPEAVVTLSRQMSGHALV